MNLTLSGLEPVLWVTGCSVSGWIVEKVLLWRLDAALIRTESKTGRWIPGTLKGMIVLWATLLGAHVAFPLLELASDRGRLVDQILRAVLIISILVVALRLVKGLLGFYVERYAPSTSSIIHTVVYVIIFIVGTLIILQMMGISITPILTTLGVGGLAVALALQDTLANLFAGLHIIATRNIRPDDFIRLASGEEGWVEDVTWRNTTIRTIQNNMVIVPNAQIASSILTNYRLPDAEFTIHVPVGVSYSSDLEKVERVTLEVASEVMKSVEGGVPGYEPVLRYAEFADFSINFRVVLKTRDALSQYRIRHEFIKKLHERFNNEGIVIPFPIRTVHLQQEG